MNTIELSAIENNFLKIFGGHILFQTLYSAVELELFEHVSENSKLSMEQISEKIGIDKQPTRILLVGLVSSGILKRDEAGLYSTTSKLIDDTLKKDSPKNLISYVKLQHHVIYKGMFHFLESLKQYKNVGLKEFEGDSPTLYGRIGNNPELKKIFQVAMQEISIRDKEELVNVLDLSQKSKLIDIGGGNGTNTISIVKKFKNLSASVFDLPAMGDLALKNIQQQGLSRQIDFVPGNCFSDEIPKGADCILLAHFCTIWSAERNRLLFKKIYNSLNKGGEIILFNMMQNDDETGPLTVALGSPYFLSIATGEGMLYTWNEYKTWLQEVGFTNFRIQKLPSTHGVIIATK